MLPGCARPIRASCSPAPAPCLLLSLLLQQRRRVWQHALHAHHQPAAERDPGHARHQHAPLRCQRPDSAQVGFDSCSCCPSEQCRAKVQPGSCHSTALKPACWARRPNCRALLCSPVHRHHRPRKPRISPPCLLLPASLAWLLWPSTDPALTTLLSLGATFFPLQANHESGAHIRPPPD